METVSLKITQVLVDPPTQVEVEAAVVVVVAATEKEEMEGQES